MQKQHRLRHTSQIQQVRQHGQARRHPLAVLIFYPNELRFSRFAFSASQQVGKAVQRNRARRLLREVVRQQMPAIQLGWDCLWIARRETAMASFTEVELAVLQLLARAHLLKSE